MHKSPKICTRRPFIYTAERIARDRQNALSIHHLTSATRVTPPPHRNTTVVRSSSWSSQNFSQLEQCARSTLGRSGPPRPNKTDHDQHKKTHSEEADRVIFPRYVSANSCGVNIATHDKPDLLKAF